MEDDLPGILSRPSYPPPGEKRNKGLGLPPNPNLIAVPMYSMTGGGGVLLSDNSTGTAPTMSVTAPPADHGCPDRAPQGSLLMCVP